MPPLSRSPRRKSTYPRPTVILAAMRGFWMVLFSVSCLVTWYYLPITQSPPTQEAAARPPRNVWIVAQSGPGRLGNQMFQFASTLGVFHERRLVANNKNNDTVHFCMDPQRSFDTSYNFFELFVGPFPTTCPADIAAQVSHLPELGYAMYQTFDTDCRLPPLNAQHEHVVGAAEPCVYTVGPYLQSFRYLEHASSQIRSSFAFQGAIQSKATAFVNQITANYNNKQQDHDITLVGIHVRRGDVLTIDYLQEAPSSYFAKAIQYYQNKYTNVVFLVATDDVQWCTKQPAFIQAGHVLFLDHDNDNDPAVDLAILAQCQHMIISVGTFGWWAGWLAGGDVVYYQDAIVLRHPTNRGQVNRDDYYPPDWIGMSG